MDRASDQTESTQTTQTKLDCGEVLCLGEQTNQEVSGGSTSIPINIQRVPKNCTKSKASFRTIWQMWMMRDRISFCLGINSLSFPLEIFAILRRPNGLSGAFSFFRVPKKRRILTLAEKEKEAQVGRDTCLQTPTDCDCCCPDIDSVCILLSAKTMYIVSLEIYQKWPIIPLFFGNISSSKSWNPQFFPSPPTTLTQANINSCGTLVTVTVKTFSLENVAKMKWHSPNIYRSH